MTEDKTHLSGIDDETDHDDGSVLRCSTGAFFHPRHTCTRAKS